jgi:hypothetical protein
MAAIASLRYFLLIRFHPYEIASLQQLRELLLGQRQDMLRRSLELLFLSVIDVRLPALGEPVHEKCLGSAPEKDDCTLAFRFSSSWTSDTLFDDFTAKVCVDLAVFGASDSVEQDRIRNSFLFGKALKPPGFEDSHECACIHSIALSAIVQGL